MEFDFKEHRRPDGKIEIHNKAGLRIDNLRGKSFPIKGENTDFTFTKAQIERMMKFYANGNRREVKLKLLNGKIAVYRPDHQPTGVDPEMHKRAT